MRRRHRHKGRGYSKRYFKTDNCAYCGKGLDGLPHSCKYCGHVHCSEHLQPENHECKGLKNIKRGFSSVNTYSPSFRNEWKENYYQRNNHQRSHRVNNYNYPNGNRSPIRNRAFKLPHIKIPRIRINKFFGSLIIAVLSYILAINVRNSLTLWIEAFAWAYFAFILYGGAFQWANRINMANDLSFFGLRILGGILAVVGVYFMFAVMFASLIVRGSAPITIPMFILLGGLILLSVFIAFKTNRRHHVVGFWRA